MNLERMAGMPERSAKGTWQIGDMLWRKELVGMSARCCPGQKEPMHTVRSWGSSCSPVLPVIWSLEELDTHLQSRAIVGKAEKAVDVQRMRTARLE